MRRIVLVIFIITMIPLSAEPAHQHKEKEYQAKWCAEHGGIAEYRLDDGSRVDCLTDEYAIEFDFAPKWAEAIGQALYYAEKTGRKPGIVLIDEGNGARFMRRLEAVSSRYHIHVWRDKKS